MPEKDLNKLKKLYLVGANTPENKELMKRWLKDTALKQYNISYDHKVINEDPTRRYFETHLAYETLHAMLGKISIKDLNEQYDSLYEATTKAVEASKKPITMETIDKVLSGEASEKSTLNQKEYSNAIRDLRIPSEQYKNFSPEERRKLELFIKSAYLGVINASLDYLPIPIYGKGIFSEESKGREARGKDHTKVRSHHLGIMKSHTPVPHNDLAFTETPSSFLRPADQFYLKDPNSIWAKDNFSRLVQTFSGAISGTMLYQLRALKYLSRLGQLKFSDENSFGNFIKCFSSVMLYNAGGHTFHEFLSPLAVPKVKEAFKFLEGFNSLDQGRLFFEGNEVAFDKALSDTIEYNKIMLKRMAVQESIKVQGQMKEAIEEFKGECESYKNYLGSLVEKELKNYPEIYGKYVSLKRRNNAQFFTSVSFDMEAIVDSVSNIKNNKDLPESAILLIERYKAVKEI